GDGLTQPGARARDDRDPVANAKIHVVDLPFRNRCRARGAAGPHRRAPAAPTATGTADPALTPGPAQATLAIERRFISTAALTFVPHMRLDLDGRVARITLDDPPVNAIGAVWLDAFAAILDRIADADDCAVLHVRSDLRVFCAGADLGEM